VRLAIACLACIGCAFDRSGTGDSIDFEDVSPIDSSVAIDIATDDTNVEPETEVDSATTDTTTTDTTTTDTTTPDTAKPDTAMPDTAMPDTAPPDPLYIECESGTLVGGMVLIADAAASNGQYANVPSTAMPWSIGTGAPPVRVELPITLPSGTWYVWVRMYTRGGDADAMYVGFEGGPLRRFYTVDWNKFVWVGAEGGGAGARLDFTLATAGPKKLYVGVGDTNTGCDRVALTRAATWTPP
jgi:hypothetical protein